MGTSQAGILWSDVRPIDVVEGHLSGTAFDAKLHFTRWAEPGDGVFEAPVSFIEMMLSRAKRVRGTFEPTARSSAYAQLGDVAFIPQRSPLYCKWSAGVQRCISCSFDIGLLAKRSGMDWSWPGFDPATALNVRNEYVQLGLRRLAEEVLSPGFASETQIECTLMFVALELRRHFNGNREAAPPSTGLLTSRQVALLRSMLIDTPGLVPTIGELAIACGMGGRQLAEAYRRTTGVTLRRFVADARLDRSKLLLLDGHTLIKQVAFDSGFKTAAAFTAAFRRATGRTPADYRTMVASSSHA